VFEFKRFDFEFKLKVQRNKLKILKIKVRFRSRSDGGRTIGPLEPNVRPIWDDAKRVTYTEFWCSGGVY
jgi:hypothetical protein